MAIDIKRKPFDKALFEQNDYKAREIVKDYIGASGLYVRDNPDIYGPDLIVYKGFKPLSYVEVEIKKVWKAGQDEFPWKTIQLPERKSKFLNLGLPIEFFILREDMQMAVVIPDYVISSKQLKEVKNKYVAEGEKFFQVDVSDCNIADLREET